jgi:hypothetical protein
LADSLLPGERCEDEPCGNENAKSGSSAEHVNVRQPAMNESQQAFHDETP